jgi:hypothetical protein
MPFALLTLLLAAEPKVHQTPPYLPRYATFQLFMKLPVVAPALRLGWNFDLVNGQRDALLLTVELGLSYTSVNQTVPFYWQYVAVAGLGYENQRESGLYWGFALLAGAAYYGFKLESKVSPYVEGRAFLGWNLGAVTLAFAAGYSQWVSYLPFSIAQLYLGGPFIGVQLGWK